MTRPWFPDRAWFEARLEGFGASEAGALLGVSPWTTARKVLNDKITRRIPDPDAPEGLRLRLGRDMEPLLLEHLWETLTERGLEVSRPRRPSPDKMFKLAGGRPYLYAHVDGFLGSSLVELKTDEYGTQPWGPEDGDPARSVPPTYYAQVQHAMVATGKRHCWLFVQLGLHAQLLYSVPLNEDYVDALLEVEDELWARVLEGRQLLAAGRPWEHLLPALEGEELSEHLRKSYPRNEELIRQATPEQELLVERLRQAKLAVKAAEREEADAAAAVQNIIREAAGLSSPLGTITWRRSADGTKVAWDLVAAGYRQALRQLLPDQVGPLYLEDHPEFAQLYTPQGEGRPALLDLEALERLYTSKTEGSRRFVPPQAWTKGA